MTWVSGFVARIASSNASPSSSGIRRSVTTTSTSPLVIVSSAARLEPYAVAATPRSVRPSARVSALAGRRGREERLGRALRVLRRDAIALVSDDKCHLRGVRGDVDAHRALRRRGIARGKQKDHERVLEQQRLVFF